MQEAAGMRESRGRETLSVVIPALNEEGSIAATLESCRGADQCIVVDGGSCDDTRRIAVDCGATLLDSAPGRGRQLSAGAREARGDVLVFVHADTRLPAGFADMIREVIGDPSISWGRFDVRFDRATPLLAVIARLISWRSRVTRGATGDQAIFVRKVAYVRVGGFLEHGLFEDVDLCRRLRRDGRMGIPRLPVVTSSRRWREGGVVRTSLRMWVLKALYLAGVPASRLERLYRDVR